MSLDTIELTLEEVFIANRIQLWRIARKIVHAADVADDVMQDAYLRIAGNSCVERKIEKPYAYCCQVVRNLALDQHRRLANEAIYRTLDVDVELLDVAGAPSPARAMIDRQAIGFVDKALEGIPPKTRLIFELYRVHGLTQRDIAARLNCALGLVNRLIADAGRAIQPWAHLLGDE